MRKEFNQDFQTRLYSVIADIESQSQVEIVVIIRSKAADYQDIPLYWGLAGGWLAHTYLMFAPELFTDILIYLGPVFAFMLCWLCGKIPVVQRWCLSKKRRQKNVELMGRALFQKGGIQHTQAKIGVLIFCSVLEEMLLVLPDRGAELAIPAENWQSLRDQLQAIFRTRNPGTSLLQVLTETQPLFTSYLPPITNDLNELPDNMEIAL